PAKYRGHRKIRMQYTQKKTEIVDVASTSMKDVHFQEDKTYYVQYDHKGRASVGLTPPLLRAASSMGWLDAGWQASLRFCRPPAPSPEVTTNMRISHHPKIQDIYVLALFFRGDFCTTPKEAWSVPRQLAYKFPLPRGLLFFFLPSPDLIYTTTTRSPPP
ncbi:unnamed protein product, partial [Ectocarpus sp. 8 AP-2014]